MPKPRLNPNQKNLIRRYLTWCYKTTKEEIDRIDRYFTQLMVDDFLIRRLCSVKEDRDRRDASLEFKRLVDEFVAYRKQKEERVVTQKFTSRDRKEVNPGYLYLQKRLEGIEEAVKYFLGTKELILMVERYEEEMILRILQSREH